MVRIEMQAKSVAKMVTGVALLLGLWACIERPMRKASNASARDSDTSWTWSQRTARRTEGKMGNVPRIPVLRPTAIRWRRLASISF